MVDDVIATHVDLFDEYPDVLVSCPARFNLFGDCAWFFRDKTISMSINLPVYIAVSERKDSVVRFVFPQMREKKRAGIHALKFRKEDRWANAVKAMIYSLQMFGIEFGGMNITVYSEILPSAGLGITTAIKIGSVAAFKQLHKIRMTDEDFLRVVETGNKMFLNARLNRADIFSVLHAKKHSCVVTDHRTNTYTVLPFKFDGHVILLTDSRVPRISAWEEDKFLSPENYILLGELKNEKRGVFGGWAYESSASDIDEVLSVANEEMRKRLSATIREHRFTLDAVDSLQQGDFAKFARTVNHSHDLQRDMFTLSCPEIDWLVKRVQETQNPADRNLPRFSREPSACSRITGKGFGRCTYTVIEKKDTAAYREKLAEYERIFGYHPLCYTVEPSGGIVTHRI
jgi:galactokinase